MKKILLSLAAVSMCALGAFAFPKAIYVKKGNDVTKYSFGVAGDLVFSNNGKTLSISGYEEQINLDDIDYISFNAIVSDALTPSDQKERLVKIGDELNSYVDLNKLSDLLNMWHCFFDHRYTSDGYSIHPPTEYEVPEEYWNVHKATRAMMKTVGKIAKGDLMATRAATNDVLDLYKLEDYFGIYTANSKEEVWKKTDDADYLEIRFDSAQKDKYFVRLEGSEAYSTWTTKDFDGQLPEKLTVTFGIGDNAFATLTIDSKLIQDQSIDMTTNFECGGYVANNVLKVVNNAVTNVSVVYSDGKELSRVENTVPGHNLVVYDEMFDAIKECTHYHDENDNCCGEDFGPLLAHFTRGKSKVDVLGQLQVNAKAFDPEGTYQVLSEPLDDDYEILMNGLYYYTSGKYVSYSNGILTALHGNKAQYQKFADRLNDYSDASFGYDKSGNIEGYLTWEVGEYSDIWEQYNELPADEVPIYGYIVKNDYLIPVQRELYWDPVHEIDVYTKQFFYYGHKYDEENGYYSEMFEVPDNDDVISPDFFKDVWYELRPLLTFPDMTTYDFEDFFDESSFGKIIDDYNDIISTYLKVTGQESDEDEYDNGYGY